MREPFAACPPPSSPREIVCLGGRALYQLSAYLSWRVAREPDPVLVLWLAGLGNKAIVNNPRRGGRARPDCAEGGGGHDRFLPLPSAA